jgi:hypothetical protein
MLKTCPKSSHRQPTTNTCLTPTHVCTRLQLCVDMSSEPERAPTRRTWPNSFTPITPDLSHTTRATTTLLAKMTVADKGQVDLADSEEDHASVSVRAPGGACGCGLGSLACVPPSPSSPSLSSPSSPHVCLVRRTSDAHDIL